MAEFRINSDRFDWLIRRIEKGDYIDGENLADALRNKDNLPFPKIFLDYLCRFLAREVRRRRGRPKVPNSKSQHLGETHRRYLGHITKRIQSGDFISGPELADVLRREDAGEIPDVWSNPDYIPDWRVHTAMPQTWEPRVFPTQTLLEPDLRVATLMKRMGIEAALVHGAAMV